MPGGGGAAWVTGARDAAAAAAAAAGYGSATRDSAALAHLSTDERVSLSINLITDLLLNVKGPS